LVLNLPALASNLEVNFSMRSIPGKQRKMRKLKLLCVREARIHIG
jgi:hypothetical protein